MPWWAAVVLAVTGVAVGFAFDAGSGKELTSVFSGLYVVGCLAAVLAVRQEGVFTAVIQPPLILFCAVPGAYFLFHGAKFTGLRDLLINCGYPLIERFPLMLFTSAGVLLLGLIRWGLGRRHPAEEAADADAGEGGRPGLVSRLTAMLHREPADTEAVDKPARSRSRRTHAVERSARSTASDARGRRPASTTRTQRVRRPLDDEVDPARERARRRRPTRDFDAPEASRRPRVPREPDDLRGRPPREVRRDSPQRRERPASRIDPYDAAEPYDAPQPPRRRPVPNGAATTHHPISQVRYRKAAGADEPLDDRASRPRRPRRPAGDSWD